MLRMETLGLGLLSLLVLPVSPSPVGPDIEARARLIKVGGPAPKRKFNFLECHKKVVLAKKYATNHFPDKHNADFGG